MVRVQQITCPRQSETSYHTLFSHFPRHCFGAGLLGWRGYRSTHHTYARQSNGGARQCEAVVGVTCSTTTNTTTGSAAKNSRLSEMGMQLAF